MLRSLRLNAAVHAPNHHRTEPWRFHVVGGDRREAMAEAIRAWLASTGQPDALAASASGKLMRAPVTVFLRQAVPAGQDGTRTLEDYAACAAKRDELLALV